MERRSPVHKLINEHGSVLYIPRTKEAQEVQAFIDRQPRVMPTGLTKARPSLGLLVFRLVLLILLAVAMGAAFLLFGEEPPEPVVRPLLTAQQRAQAFRL
jgi:hypothetical protein